MKVSSLKVYENATIKNQNSFLYLQDTFNELETSRLKKQRTIFFKKVKIHYEKEELYKVYLNKQKFGFKKSHLHSVS